MGSSCCFGQGSPEISLISTAPGAMAVEELRQFSDPRARMRYRDRPVVMGGIWLTRISQRIRHPRFGSFLLRETENLSHLSKPSFLMDSPSSRLTASGSLTCRFTPDDKRFTLLISPTPLTGIRYPRKAVPCRTGEVTAKSSSI